MSEHTELPWRYCKLEGLWGDTIEALDGQRIARLCNNKAANAEFIILACNTFADIEEGVSMIVRKDHYYQLEAQAKSQPDLLEALQYVITVIKDDDLPWWMDCPDKGGFDVEKLETAIEKAAP